MSLCEIFLFGTPKRAFSNVIVNRVYPILAVVGVLGSFNYPAVLRSLLDQIIETPLYFKKKRAYVGFS